MSLNPNYDEQVHRGVLSWTADGETWHEFSAAALTARLCEAVSDQLRGVVPRPLVTNPTVWPFKPPTDPPPGDHPFVVPDYPGWQPAAPMPPWIVTCIDGNRADFAVVADTAPRSEDRGTPQTWGRPASMGES